jgi:putative ABC transport system permease protein
MFGNYLSTALGNLLRNKLLAAINLFGLALGLATAILIGLYVRDELTFEHFLPGHELAYRLQTVDVGADGKPTIADGAPHELAAALRDNFPEIDALARRTGGRYGLRNGSIEAPEVLDSVDPDFFKIIGYPLLVGDPATALSKPNSIALPRVLALKYFGTVDCLDKTLEIDRKETVRITAVYEDLPSNTIFALYGPRPVLSGRTPISNLAQEDRETTAPAGSFETDSALYVRLKPGTSVADFNARLSDFIAKRYPQNQPSSPPRSGFLLPIDAIHLHPQNYNDFVASGDLETVYGISATGVLVLLVAGINFVNLVTARATRRALEVGVRKAAGATRRQLIAQFMSESIAYAVAALLLAVALVELVLPSFDRYMDRTITFPYWRDPILVAGLPLLAVGIGLLAGIYPALVLSGFRPAAVLKGAAATPGSGMLRQVLVVLQYAISIALLIATAVIYRQTEFATQGSLRFDKDQIVAISLSGIPDARVADTSHFEYDAAMVERVRQRLETVPGVKAAADSWVIPDALDSLPKIWHRPEAGGPPITTSLVMQGFGLFEVYGVRPIAGRSFSRDHGEDAAPQQAQTEGTVILNESAVRAFGFASAGAAIGQELDMALDDFGRTQPRRIVGVVPDMPLFSIRMKIPPTTFVIDPAWSNYINVKLTGDKVPEALAAIDAIWKELVPAQPIQRQFIDDRLEKLYRDVARQGHIFAGFALIAVLIACLGLFGLAAFTAERRTKEIGIRKAMGADTADILKLLVWEFVKPVLLANALAWPLAYVAMAHWLDGFAYRIELDPLFFVGAGLIALVIACSVTLFHAFQVARSRPVLALRYE